MTSIEAGSTRRLASLSRNWVCGLLLALCLAPLNAAEPLRMVISMTPLALPIFVAESQGYFAAEGLQLQLQEVVGGHRALQLLNEGKADLATVSEVVVMFNSFSPPQFAVLASFVSGSNNSKLVLRPNTGIKQIKDLKGRCIGTVLGTSSHYMLELSLLASGVDPKDVKIIHVQPEAMADSLKSAAVDAVAIWEPLPFKLLQAVPGSSILPTVGSYWLSFNLIAAKHLLGRRDDELEKLLRALDRAARFIATQPAQAQTLLRERLKLDQAFVDWIWADNHYRLNLDQWLLSSMEAESRWARQGGLAKDYVKGAALPNYLDLIYAKPLRKALPSGVGLIE